MRVKKGISFQYKIFFGCMMAALIPICLNMVIMRQFEAVLERNSLEEGNESLKEAKQKLEQLLNECNIIMEQLQEKNLFSELSESESPDSSKIYLYLYQITDSLAAGTKITIYNPFGVLQYSTDSGPLKTSLPINWGRLRKAFYSKKVIYYTLETGETDGKNPLLSAVKAVRNEEGSVIGYLEMTFSKKSFSQVFSGLKTPRMNGYLLNELGHIVYSDGTKITSEKEEKIRALCSYAGERERITLGEEQYLLSWEESSGYSIILEQRNPISAQSLRTIRFFSYAGIFISLAISAVLAILFSRSLFKPVSQISQAMKRVESGELNTRVLIDREDELGNLAESFNHMAENLKEYVETAAARSKELNESQIRLLQAQLNPHFLYNTLDTVKWIAKINHIPEIAKIAENLAVILRQSISKKQFVTLKEEEDMVKSYLDIQLIRFSERFTCEIDIPPELERYIVPKLMLQPIVENSILHGLDEREDGRIEITAKASGRILKIMIRDNGKGMNQEMVERINEREVKMADGHLGLYNVNRMIGLHYGFEYGLKAISCLSEGTTITVTLPGGEEEEDA